MFLFSEVKSYMYYHYLGKSDFHDLVLLPYARKLHLLTSRSILLSNFKYFPSYRSQQRCQKMYLNELCGHSLRRQKLKDNDFGIGFE